MHTKNFFMYNPGGETSGGNSNPRSEGEKSTVEELSQNVEEVKHKSFSEKVHDALQQWSNDDQRDQEIDDRTP